MSTRRPWHLGPYTVESLITHTPRLRPQGMGYWRVWTFGELVKIASKNREKMLKIV